MPKAPPGWSSGRSCRASRAPSSPARRPGSKISPSGLKATFWERLRERAVEIHDEGNLERRLEAGEKLRVKLGMDPTAPDIHVGHLVVLDVLAMFQAEGHTAVLIIGDYTAQIGDPSGRSQTRPVLTREQVEANARTYFEQAFRVLDRERTEIRHNSEWLGPMTAADILRLLGKQTLQSVLQREDFSNRIRVGHPIGAHEILYPFSQAYDSVAVDADLEIGGTDQLFNLLYGREIMRAYGKSPQEVAVFPLLEGLDGVNKMSKSLANYIGITDPPDEIYGKVMSIPDGMTARYAKLLLRLEPSDLPADPRDAKAGVAFGLTERLQGTASAKLAEEQFDLHFRQRQAPTEIVEITPSRGNLITVVLEAGFAKSASEARRLLAQGGVKVDGLKVGEDVEVAGGSVVSVGKRNFVRVRLG